MLKAVIFDMDGVIIDSEPLHAKANVMTMAEYGIKFDAKECNNFIGSTNQYMFECLREKYHLEASIDELIRTDNRILAKLVKEEGYPCIPYIKDTIINLHQNGILLAIASSSSPEQIEEVVKMLDLSPYFDKLVSGATVPNSKPAPDVFLKALDELGVKAEEALIIEDSMNGVLASVSANVPAIGFINPNSGKQDLSKAFVLIESFENITYEFLLNEYLHAHDLPITIATTKRLIIKELSVEDVVQMYTIYQSPEVKEFIDDIDDYLEDEIEKHKAYIKNVYHFYGYGLWGVFSKETGKLIGRCGIQNNKINGKSEIEISYLLDVNHWGLGYALECVRTTLSYASKNLDLKRIVAVIDKENTRSIKVANSAGFHKEDEIRYKNRDCYLYAIENF